MPDLDQNATEPSATTPEAKPVAWKPYKPRRNARGVESVLYDRLEARRVRCNVCAFRCVIAPGHGGACRVRHNIDGTLVALNYHKITALEIDPVEKKPLYHFHPGSAAFSYAAPGCNFRCRYCQNAEISQMVADDRRLEGRTLTPEWVVDQAVRHGCESIAHTYTEPTIYIELAAEVGTLAKARGLRNIFVSNGYQTPESTELVAPWLDAINIDLKGFDDRYYLKVCGARVAPVCASIERFVDLGVWTEVSTLVVPGYNDSDAELRDAAQFLAGVSLDIPWHLVGFHPDYKMRDVPPTPLASLERARDIGREAGLRYVYIANVPAPGAGDTLCPECGAAAIRRDGTRVTDWRLSDGHCHRCGARIAGVGMVPPVRVVQPETVFCG